MLKKLSLAVLTAEAFAVLTFADAQTFTGIVSDDHCGAKHSAANDEAATCVAKCVQGGAKYVLVSSGKIYQLDAQDKFKDFAGKSVTVKGTLNEGTITVESVGEAPAQ
ncbi:MAG: hypothetical protein DMG22_23375 [Acidobacteria bacterium]|nr:MAG: hypothetical protein DMG22_23375 [Acidobacteriota bacterium]